VVTDACRSRQEESEKKGPTPFLAFYLHSLVPRFLSSLFFSPQPKPPCWFLVSCCSVSGSSQMNTKTMMMSGPLPPRANEVQEEVDDAAGNVQQPSDASSSGSDAAKSVAAASVAPTSPPESVLVANVSVTPKPETPTPDAGSASPPTSVVAFVAACGSAASSSSGSSSQSHLNMLNQLDVRFFRCLGVALLVLQVLATVAFTCYAWCIENTLVVDSAACVFHPWCVVTSLAIAIPYPANSFLFRMSSIICMLSTHAVWVDCERFCGERAVAGWLAGAFSAIFLLMSWGVTEIVARSCRHVMTEQWQLNAWAIAPLGVSFKTFWLVAFLLPAAIGGLGGRSWSETQDALDVSQCDADTNEEDLTIACLHDRMTTAEILDGCEQTARAITFATATHTSLLFSLVLVSMAPLSSLNVLQGQVAPTEGIALFAIFALGVNTLTVLSAGCWASHLVSILCSLIVFLCCGKIALSILRDKDPCSTERRVRADDHRLNRMDAEETLRFSPGDMQQSPRCKTRSKLAPPMQRRSRMLEREILREIRRTGSPKMSVLSCFK